MGVFGDFLRRYPKANIGVRFSINRVRICSTVYSFAVVSAFHLLTLFRPSAPSLFLRSLFFILRSSFPVSNSSLSPLLLFFYLLSFAFL
jgi:hypothetical protein